MNVAVWLLAAYDEVLEFNRKRFVPRENPIIVVLGVIGLGFGVAHFYQVHAEHAALFLFCMLCDLCCVEARATTIGGLAGEAAVPELALLFGLSVKRRKRLYHVQAPLSVL